MLIYMLVIFSVCNTKNVIILLSFKIYSLVLIDNYYEYYNKSKLRIYSINTITNDCRYS